MPARDIYHDTVKETLIKDGWKITDDPYFIEFEKVRVFADLAAEKEGLFAAERTGRRIVVEVKTFGGASRIADLEQALGQYCLYRSLLKQMGERRDVFLAIAVDVYEDFFLHPGIGAVIADQQIKLLVFHPDHAEVVQWIE